MLQGNKLTNKKTNNMNIDFELIELNENELLLIEGGSHLRDFAEGIACGLAGAGFIMAVMLL
jgi:hypothetical protein